MEQPVFKESEVLSIRRSLLHWGKENGRKFPWRETKRPFRILIAEVLLHQTFARKVVPVYLELISRYPAAEILATANIVELEGIIRPLGLLYRANTLVDMSKQLVQEFDGQVPSIKEDLLLIKGVGPYTASAILCFAFGRSEAIIDTNVLRVYRRVFNIMDHFAKSKPDQETIAVAKSIVSRTKPRRFNWALLDFAANICSHRTPQCSICPLARFCAYGQHASYQQS